MLMVQRFSYRLLKGFLAVVLYLTGIASIFLLKTPLGVNVNGATFVQSCVLPSVKFLTNSHSI